MVKDKIQSISLDGGILCLDFTNTVQHRYRHPLPDYLTDIDDLLDWCERVNLLDLKKLKLLRKQASDSARKGSNFFQYAISLRETLYRIFLAVSRGTKISSDDLNELNEAIKAHFAHVELTYNAEGFKESWRFAEDSFHVITAPVVKNAYELLASTKLDRVKECPNCGWLFLDTTKNGKRRWCSMKACGSTVKALEWYHRNKAH